MGYEIKTVKDSKKCLKFLTNECAVCVLPDGREVEVTELMGLRFKETTCSDGVWNSRKLLYMSTGWIL